MQPVRAGRPSDAFPTAVGRAETCPSADAPAPEGGQPAAGARRSRLRAVAAALGVALLATVATGLFLGEPPQADPQPAATEPADSPVGGGEERSSIADPATQLQAAFGVLDAEARAIRAVQSIEDLLAPGAAARLRLISRQGLQRIDGADAHARALVADPLLLSYLDHPDHRALLRRLEGIGQQAGEVRVLLRLHHRLYSREDGDEPTDPDAPAMPYGPERGWGRMYLSILRQSRGGDEAIKQWAGALVDEIDGTHRPELAARARTHTQQAWTRSRMQLAPAAVDVLAPILSLLPSQDVCAAVRQTMLRQILAEAADLPCEERRTRGGPDASGPRGVQNPGARPAALLGPGPRPVFGSPAETD